MATTLIWDKWDRCRDNAGYPCSRSHGR